MAEPSRLLAVPFLDLPLMADAGRSSVPQSAVFFVVRGTVAYGYAFADKAAALVYWRALAGYVSDSVLSASVSLFVFNTDAAYIAGSVGGPAAFERLSALDSGAGFALDATGLIASITGAGGSCRSTRAHRRGIYFAECAVGAKAGAAQDLAIGIAQETANINFYPGTDNKAYGWEGDDGGIRNAGLVATRAVFGPGDMLGLLLDCEAGALTFYKNGVAQAPVAVGAAAASWYLIVGPGYGGSAGTQAIVMNFGATAFSMAIPAGATRW